MPLPIPANLPLPGQAISEQFFQGLALNRTGRVNLAVPVTATAHIHRHQQFNFSDPTAGRKFPPLTTAKQIAAVPSETQATDAVGIGRPQQGAELFCCRRNRYRLIRQAKVFSPITGHAVDGPAGASIKRNRQPAPSTPSGKNLQSFQKVAVATVGCPPLLAQRIPFRQQSHQVASQGQLFPRLGRQQQSSQTGMSRQGRHPFTVRGNPLCFIKSTEQPQQRPPLCHGCRWRRIEPGQLLYIGQTPTGQLKSQRRQVRRANFRWRKGQQTALLPLGP